MSEEVKVNEEVKQDELEKGQTETKEEKVLTEKDIQKIVQSETDKVRTEYSTRLKELEKQKAELEKEKMSEEEKRQFDLDKLTKELAQKEIEIKNRELTIKTVDLLKDLDLPLEFREFVIGADEDDTVKRVEKFGELWTTALEVKVRDRFKESGRQIKQGTEPTVNAKDFSKMTYTERLKLKQDHEETYNKLTKQ